MANGPVVTIDVLDNDDDVEDDTLTITAVDDTATTGGVAIVSGGTEVQYTPDPTFDIQLFYFPEEVASGAGGTRFVPGSHLRRTRAEGVSWPTMKRRIRRAVERAAVAEPDGG